jgi:hypothetical protein
LRSNVTVKNAGIVGSANETVVVDGVCAMTWAFVAYVHWVVGCGSGSVIQATWRPASRGPSGVRR